MTETNESQLLAKLAPGKRRFSTLSPIMGPQTTSSTRRHITRSAITQPKQPYSPIHKSNNLNKPLDATNSTGTTTPQQLSAEIPPASDDTNQNSPTIAVTIANNSTPDYSALHPNMPEFVSDIYDTLRQLTSHQQQQDHRLHQMEAVIAENQQLRTQLHDALQTIQQLEQRLQQQSRTTTAPPDDSMNLDTNASTQPIQSTPDDFFSQGTSASRHAQPQSTAAKPQQHTPNSQPTYANIAKNPPRRSMRRVPTSPAAIASAARTFAPISSNQGYQFIYLNTRGRDSESVMRYKLRTLHIHSGRVINIHYPDRHVVALLVHNDYAEEATSILTTAGIPPLTSFNPANPALLRDPAFSNLSPEDRTEKA